MSRLSDFKSSGSLADAGSHHRPLLSAVWPVLDWRRHHSATGYCHYGLEADFGSTGSTRAVERIGRRLMPLRYAMALTNLFRRKARLVLTQLVLVAAGAMFLIVMSLSASVTQTVDNDLARRAYDLRVNFQRPPAH